MGRHRADREAWVEEKLDRSGQAKMAGRAGIVNDSVVGGEPVLANNEVYASRERGREHKS